MIRIPPILRTLLLALLLAGSLSACTPLLVGGAATAVFVASDRRTAGEQLEDQVIEIKIASEMRDIFPNTEVRVNSTAHAGVVLLTGDVPTQTDRQRAEQAARRVERVVRVVNRLRVGDITPFSVRSNDTWLTSKVRANLIATSGVPSSSILIMVERGTVYLMGRVTREEANLAAQVAADINGVNQVVALFDVAPHERLASSTFTPAARNNTASHQTPPYASGDQVQTMPVR